MGKGLKTNRLAADGAFLSYEATITRSGWLRKILVTVDSTGFGEALIYDDSAAATGTLLIRVACVAADATAGATGESLTYSFDFPGAGISYSNGMYLDLSGGTTAVQAYWDE